MKNNIILTILLAFTLSNGFSQIIYSDLAYTKFDSHALMKEISAVNNNSTCSVDISNGEVVSTVKTDEFTFQDPLMQHAFKKEYVESEKFPVAVLNAKITNLDEINFKKEGTYKANLSGTIEIHGEKQDINIEGKILVDEKNIITAQAAFNIKLNLFKIIIPEYNKLNISNDIQIYTEFKFYDLLFSSN